MASELTTPGTISFTKAPASLVSMNEAGKSFDVTGTKSVRGVQNIAITAEAINLGDVGTPGWFFIRNLDTTHFVELFTAAAGVAFQKLKPGEFTIGRFAVAAPAAQADTATCNIEYLIVED